jgi:D-methionine transport system substrate-binding protein
LRAIIVVMRPSEQVLCSGEENKMKKRFVSVIAAVLSAALLAGCGGSGASTSASGDQAASAAGSEESKTITVAASPTPHSEILEAAKPLLAEKGYELDIKVFEDYVQPNEVVNSGEIDCNYFQHVPYLESFNEEKGTDLVVAGKIHYEPLGIYPGTKKTLEEIGEGDVIAVPNDTTNEARALLLLQDNGIIKLKDGAGITATKQDIAENPHNVEIKELEAAQIPHVKDEVAYSVMNGNYALQAGLIAAKDALSYELPDSEAAATYVNVIAVKAGNEENEGIKALVEVLKSEDIKKFIADNYDGAVIVFEE